MDPLLPVALQLVRQVQTTTDGPTYDEFRQTLKQYGHRTIHFSNVISTLHQLFHAHQTLLDSFQSFLPLPIHPAPPPEDPNVRRCLDFLNRVGARFYGGRTYANFLYCVLSYARADMTASDVRHKALELFGENDDIFDEFLCFLPEPCVGETSEQGMKRKRKRGSDSSSPDDEFLRSSPEPCVGETSEQGMKRSRGSDSSSPDDEETLRRWRRALRPRLNYYGAAAKRVGDRHNHMSDLMCAVDVKIENLKTCIKKTEELHGNLSRGRLYAAKVRLDKHFTTLNLACIRMFDCTKFLEVSDDEDMVRALSELKEVLLKKKEGLERERLKIVQRWN